MPGTGTCLGGTRLAARRRSRRSTRTSAVSRSIRCRRSTASGDPAQFDGAWAAISGDTDEALAVARELAETLGLRPFELADGDRTLYHAGAVFASNYLVTLQRAARLFGSAFRRRGARAADARDDRARLRADRPDRARRLGDGRGAQSRRSRRAHPELEHLYETLAGATVALA